MMHKRMIAVQERLHQPVNRQKEELLPFRTQKQETQPSSFPTTKPQNRERHSQAFTCTQSSDNKRNFAKPWQMTLNWREGGKVPFAMSRGASTVNGDVSYFMHWNGKTCSYNSTNRKWVVLPKYPNQYASLVVIDGSLTGIGGCSGNTIDVNMYTNKLFSYHKRWEEALSPMPTKRRDVMATALTTHVIVAGGMCGPFINSCLTTVEVMDTNSLVWSRVASLPHPYTGASITTCGDQLIMLGGFDNQSETKSALTCSLMELIQSTTSPVSMSVWHSVADTPAYQSTCATISGELLAVGGCDSEDKATDAIHKYNPMTNSWDVLGKMPTARYNCLIAVLTNNKIITVGGDVNWNKPSDRAEICSFNQLDYRYSP